MKKILSILLVLVMLATLFVGCNGTDENKTDDNGQNNEQSNDQNNDEKKPTYDQILADAENAMKDIPYELSVTYTYTSDNKEYNDIFASMSTSLKSLIKGKTFKTSMSAAGMEYETILVGDVLYYSFPAMEAYLKAPVTEADYEKLFSSYAGTDMGMSEDDFESAEMTEKDGAYVIAFTNVKEEMYDEIVEESVGIGVEASISNLNYTITVKDDKFVSVSLEMDMQMTVEGVSQNIHMVADCTYKYDGLEEIAAPEGADTYTEVTLSEILGE